MVLGDDIERERGKPDVAEKMKKICKKWLDLYFNEE